MTAPISILRGERSSSCVRFSFDKSKNYQCQVWCCYQMAPHLIGPFWIWQNKHWSSGLGTGNNFQRKPLESYFLRGFVFVPFSSCTCEIYPMQACCVSLPGRTYRGAWRATRGQWWSDVCKRQWGVVGWWHFLPSSYCTDPPCTNQQIPLHLNQSIIAQFVLFMLDRFRASECFWQARVASKWPIAVAYFVLSSIQCSSCWVMFWFLHSVRFATMTPGLKEHVLALIPSFLIASFLKSRKPI